MFLVSLGIDAGKRVLLEFLGPYEMSAAAEKITVSARHREQARKPLKGSDGRQLKLARYSRYKCNNRLFWSIMRAALKFIAEVSAKAGMRVLMPVELTSTTLHWRHTSRFSHLKRYLSIRCIVELKYFYDKARGQKISLIKLNPKWILGSDGAVFLAVHTPTQQPCLDPLAAT